MSRYTPSPLGTLANEQAAVAKINENLTNIATALEGKLSRTGTNVPNHMSRDLDMNSHDLLNVGAIFADRIVATEPPPNPFENSAFVNYTPQGSGTVHRTVQDKLRESVSVKDFGAVGDGVADDTVAIQAALTYCTTNGAELFFPKGSYRTTSTLTIDRSANSLDPTDGALPGISLRGSSPASAQILSDHDGVCLSFLGGPNAGWHTFFYIDGIGLTKKVKNRATGSIGLHINRAAFVQIQRFDTSFFEYGIYGTDVLSSAFMDGTVRLNNYGFRFERNARSRPNAITFRGVITLNNQIYGGAVYGPSEFNYIGGTIESNGYTGILADPNSWGLYIENAGGEGSVGAYLAGVYIEGNNGIADLWFVQTGNTVREQVMNTVSGCSFLRFSDTRYVTQNIRINNGVGNNSITTVNGSGFKDFSPYVSSDARPFIGAGNAQVIDGGGNLFCDSTGGFTGVASPIFAPLGVHHRLPFSALPSASRNPNGIAYCSDGGGGPLRPSLAVSDGTQWWQIVLGSFAGAVASVGSAQTLPRGWTSTKSGTGVYTITHNLNLSNTTYSVVASPTGTPGTGYCSGMALSNNSFELYFANTAGAPTDMAFNFTVSVI